MRIIPRIWRRSVATVDAWVEVVLRRRDQARILLDAQRADAALLSDPRDGAYWRTRMNLLCTEGLLQLREIRAAETLVVQAVTDIRLHDLHQ